MKIAILGFAREGRSILKFLKKDKEFRNAEIWVLDRNGKSVSSIKYPAFAKASAGKQVSGIQTGKNYLKNLGGFGIIFRTPGIPYLLPEIQKAKKSGVKITSATNLFFERCPGTIVGITGTKGKGTTCTILYQMLKAAGKKVFLAGNIGKPALDILSDAQINADGHADKRGYKNISENQRKHQRESAYVILELSSFQLQDIKKSPSVAAVLDIFPDHLDAHKNLKEYYDAKANIGRHQKNGDKIFFFGNSTLSRRVASKGKGKKIAVHEKSFNLFSPEDLQVKGMHNFKNAVMAATIAESLGVSGKTILEAVRKFRGTKHRLELVRKMTKNGGEISFYNDSASTNPQTAVAAIEAFPDENKILIAGGQDKKLDYKPFAKALKNSGTKLVILLGENKNKIAKTIKRIKNNELRIVLVNTLSQAVKFAYKFAERLSIIHNSSFIILFSPAATSFDMFKNYADRGEKFKKIVKGLR